MSGGDMKLIAAAILAFCSPGVLIPVTLIGGVQGGVALFCNQTFVPYVLSIFLGTMFSHGLRPSQN
jgi:hypothetical protein